MVVFSDWVGRGCHAALLHLDGESSFGRSKACPSNRTALTVFTLLSACLTAFGQESSSCKIVFNFPEKVNPLFV
jgi:hypothetical protein